MTTPCTCVPHWTGNRAGHCTTCCQTFTSESGFTRHLITNRGRYAGCREPYSTVDRNGAAVFTWNTRRRMWQLAGGKWNPRGDQ